jgi:hypothetical protein
MRADGTLAILDRWGRAALPGTVLLFFVLLTLAPLRAPYLSDTLPLLPVLVVFQFSLVTPERLPGPLLLVMGILLDLLLGGPGAPVGISALGFILVRAAISWAFRSCSSGSASASFAGATWRWSGPSRPCGHGQPSIRSPRCCSMS